MDLKIRSWEDYELVDSGLGRKLERFGAHLLIRLEPRAVWKPARPGEWEKAVLEYKPAEKGGGGAWDFRKEIEGRWKINYGDLKFWVAIENSRQVGFFPENEPHWKWIYERVINEQKPIRVLNLFGYSGASTIAAAKAGAAVTHVDASKRALNLGKANQDLNGLNDALIRWIADDALKFVQRERRRGNKYEGIIMDPPKYGLGPKKERWEFSKGFERLCAEVKELISEEALFIVVTAYGINLDADDLESGMKAMLARRKGKLEAGKMMTLEESAGRWLHHSIYARWERIR